MTQVVEELGLLVPPVKAQFSQVNDSEKSDEGGGEKVQKFQSART
jgi:hypothetical protein